MFSSEKSGKKGEKDAFDDTPRCGIWGWTPSWLQKLANMQVFIFFYVCLGLIYGMAHSYTSSMIPSIEKRFGFTSKSTGTILAMNDVSHILVALLTAHYGGSSHRPRWISFGCLVIGASLLLHALPEILFPMTNSATLQSSLDKVGGLDASDDMLCVRNHSPPLSTLSTGKNTSAMTGQTCEAKADNPLGPMIVLGVAQFFLGVGSTTLMVLGFPFIDDNTQKTNSALYIAISFSSRVFGPVLGFMIGAYCNTIYYDWSKPSFKQSDPRWISAWFLGYLGTGLGLCVFALPMGCFPSSLPRKERSIIREAQSQPAAGVKSIEAGNISSEPAAPKEVSLKDLPRNVKKLLVNQAYIYGVVRVVLEGLVISGYLSFLPKFLGQQFQLSPSAASLAGGVPSVLAVALGSLLGGIAIKRFNLQPKHIGLALTFSAALTSTAFFGAMGLGCHKTVISDVSKQWKTPSHPDYRQADEQTCFSLYSCGCSMSNFNPVCDPATMTNYYSPCHAGCQTSTTKVNESKTYGKCLCAKNANVTWRRNSEPDVAADASAFIGGFCPKKCSNLSVFIAIMFVAMLVTGTPLSGSIMVQFQVVGKDLKSMATGLQVLLWSALGLLPGPIIVGSIVDSSCDLWQTKSCGEKGFCLLYDTDSLRWKLHLYAGIIKLAGAVVDVMLTYKVWKVTFDTEEVTADGHSSTLSGPALVGLAARTDEDFIPPKGQVRMLQDKPNTTPVNHP